MPQQHARRRSSATPSSRYQPLARSSIDSQSSTFSTSSQSFKDKPLPLTPSKRRRLSHLARKGRRCVKGICRPLYLLFGLVLFICWQLLFNASYLDAWAPGYEAQMERAKGERVFVAANIIDGDLIRGAWGRSLLELVDRIGKERVFVSVYGGPKDALLELGSMLECEYRIVFEGDDPVDLGDVKRTRLPSGESRVKRIAFLAEVRNMVLRPLRDGSAFRSMRGVGVFGKGGFDKVLFINDVWFSAEGATRLLWGTKEEYKAVCAADFVTSWKYYDTFATRDAEGFSIGVPLFPWFAAEGEAVSRDDVLAGRDAVRVKSCWGGMVAFDGRYFQSGFEGGVESVSEGNHDETQNSAAGSGKKVDGMGRPEIPLLFRSEAEPFWDSSECCLIHADIMSLPSFPSISSGKSGQDDSFDTGIYLNPYVRTAYSASAYTYIPVAKRFERLFSPLQRILNYFAHMPRYNYRREEKEGMLVPDKLWISTHSNMTVEESIALAIGGPEPTHVLGNKTSGLEKRATLGEAKGKEYWGNEGYYVTFNRTARRGGYCGVRQLLVLKEGATEGGNWDNLLDKVPPVDV